MEWPQMLLMYVRIYVCVLHICTNTGIPRSVAVVIPLARASVTAIASSTLLTGHRVHVFPFFSFGLPIFLALNSPIPRG
jgi:hypothetical protein